MNDISAEPKKARDARIACIEDQISELLEDEAPDEVLCVLVSQIVGTVYAFDDPEREMLDFMKYLTDEFHSVKEIRKDAGKRRVELPGSGRAAVRSAVGAYEPRW